MQTRIRVDQNTRMCLKKLLKVESYRLLKNLLFACLYIILYETLYYYSKYTLLLLAVSVPCRVLFGTLNILSGPRV